MLPPGPGGRGEEGRLSECALWALPGLGLLCVTRALGTRWGGSEKLLAAASVLCLGFPPPFHL